MDVILRLRSRVASEEFDYRILMDALSDLSSPRDKVTALLRSKEIIRVKKGLYIFGESNSKNPYSREILANLIYGPSALSLDYALHFYGLIPERVEILTSVTTGKNKQFDSPVGRFTYIKIPLTLFSEGVDQISIDKSRSFLMVCPERALTDRIITEKKLRHASAAEIQGFLFDHLRVDRTLFYGLSVSIMKRIAHKYQDPRISALLEILSFKRKKR